MVDEGQLEEVLALVSLQDIAEAWSCFHERQTSNGWAATADPDWWAVDFWVTTSHASGPESAIREGLLALVDTVPEELLTYVGAGPLMNFVGPDEDRSLDRGCRCQVTSVPRSVDRCGDLARGGLGRGTP